MRTALEALKVTKDIALEQARRELSEAALKVEERVETAIMNGMAQVEVEVTAVDARFTDSIIRLYKSKGYRVRSKVCAGFLANGYLKQPTITLTIAWA